MNRSRSETASIANTASSTVAPTTAPHKADFCMTSSLTEHKIALEEREDWKIRGKISESSGRATPDRKDPRVIRGVDHEDNDRDRELHAARQHGRINQAIDVMRDEAFFVALNPRA